MISVSLASPIPLHDQLVAELRRLIATGRVVEGDALPPVRQLAADLGINLNTVARAYRELTDAGLLASSRGRGTVVLSSKERAPGRPEEARKRLDEVLGAALADAKLAGFSREQTTALVDRHLSRLFGP